MSKANPDFTAPDESLGRVYYQHPIPGLEMGRSTLNLNNIQFHHTDYGTHHIITAFHGTPRSTDPFSEEGVAHFEWAKGIANRSHPNFKENVGHPDYMHHYNSEDSRSSTGRQFEPGEIMSVGVDRKMQYRGLATAMIETARNLGISPLPQHSPDRTDAGEDWSKHVGGERPPNNGHYLSHNGDDKDKDRDKDKAW